MKFLPFLLIAFFLFACQSNSSQSEESTPKTQKSTEWLALEGKSDKPHIVFVSGDEEYRSEEALPQLAKILNQHHGFNCTVLFAQHPDKPGIVDPNYLHNITGLEQLATADMMVIFTRFRALPEEQMQHFEDYLLTGKPVLGIRTATHAFNFTDKKIDSSYHQSPFLHYGNYYKGEDEWLDGFGRLVLGEKWISHHGHHKHESTRGIPAEGATSHPILNGIGAGDIWGATDVYGVRLPMQESVQPIVLGQVVKREGEMDENDIHYGMRPTDSMLNEEKNDPTMPIAWTKTYQIPNGKPGKTFATTIGSSSDLLAEGVRRMMINGVYWCLGMDVPERADVSLVGEYAPSRFAFHDDEHWVRKHIVIEEMYSDH